MGGISRRAFLALPAAALAAPGARALAPCEAIAHDAADARALLAFVDEAAAPQGARISELRARLAVHGLGEERARFETLVAPATGDAARMRCIMEALAAARPLLACTASAAAARAMVRALPALPVLFSVEVDPVAAGIVDAIGPRRANATGFTFDLPLAPDRKALETLALAFPRARRLLVVAHADWQRHAGRQEDLREARRRLGVDVAVAGYEAPWSAIAALRALEPRAGEACYVPRSEALHPALDALAAHLRHARLGHLFGDERALRHGAMLAFAPRALAHWDALASMARLVAAGRAARDIPVQRPAEFLLSVSLAPWQPMGLRPPVALLRRAHAVL